MKYRTRFGENREVAILRDKEQCVLCGLTRRQHKTKYGRDITVDHIDGKGRNTPEELMNNSLKNLRTLCLKCHGASDYRRRKDLDSVTGENHPLHKLTSEDVRYIRNAWQSKLSNQSSLAERFGVSPALICRIIQRDVWKHI